MYFAGRVQNGAVVLEEGTALPEGAKVMVIYPPRPNIRVAAIQRPVQLPLVAHDGPPDISLTNDQIASVLMAEDASR